MDPTPDFIEIRESTIPNAGLGAFTKIKLCRNMLLGVYKGVLLTEKEADDNPGSDIYYMESKRDDGCIVVIDAFSLEHSNWTRYLNCSQTHAKANVVCIDRKNGVVELYTKKTIMANTELFFYYGKEYAREIFCQTT